jgi:hypothetical protein
VKLIEIHIFVTIFYQTQCLAFKKTAVTADETKKATAKEARK